MLYSVWQHLIVRTLTNMASSFLFRSINSVEGKAAGAGSSLAFGCDFVLAEPGARFSQIFVRRALSLDCGGTWLLPRLVGLRRAKELALFGDWVDADRALELGLVNRVAPSGELAEMGDLMMMRFLAIENAADEKSWTVASTMELIPDMT